MIYLGFVSDGPCVTWQLYVAAPHMSAYLMDFLLLRVCACLAHSMLLPMP